MPHIKELIIHGFKSFARETKVPFTQSMNVIVGPNGSGKSNVTDAICFVLGRLGSKSMRAKKLANLIFAGTDKYKPSKEASVEMVFDNSDKGFSLNEKTVSIKRILRRNGQGVYKINEEIKTRQEILELLAQAGIDPNGFNIVLQGEIDSFVKMPPDKRREVIEEVAGISIYEIRKKRSLNELEKTEQKLKEVNATLRERQAYLRNLEEERKQALRFKKLQQEAKDLKFTILQKIIKEKSENIEQVNKKIKAEDKRILDVNELIEKNKNQISILNGKIEHLTNNIQKSSGIEQEKLNTEISDLRAEIAGLDIRRQSLESQIRELKSRKKEVEETINNIRKEIEEFSKSKFKGVTIKPALESKKQELEQIEDKKRKFYQLKSQVSTFKSRIEDKKTQIQKQKNEQDFTLNRIEELESKILIKEPLDKQQQAVSQLRSQVESLSNKQTSLQTTISEHDKKQASLETQIQELEKVKSKVSSLDICPLCKTKMTKEHVSKVVEETKQQQAGYLDQIKKLEHELKQAQLDLQEAKDLFQKSELELKTRAQDILRLEIIQEKKSSLRSMSESRESLEKEKQDLESKYEKLEAELATIKTSEERYDSLRLEIQELERAQEKDLGMDITIKQRDIERLKNTIKQAEREIEESSSDLEEVEEDLEEKQSQLHIKTERDEILRRKFKSSLEEKNQYQEKIRFFETDILHKQNQKHGIEQVINNLKIERAQFAAQKQSQEEEALDPSLKDCKILRMSIQEARIKLDQTQRTIDHIGTVNMRALEVYEDFKKQYENIQEKADTLIKEKEEILKVIEDIDKKKRKVFLETLKKINELFSRNFSQLSTKGIASLEPVDKENLFDSGLEMLIKVGKGKFFDTHLLSGGEQCLVSLALIFAIQEYKPYCFYIFDEIDAALDRRNSERLANLLKKYMRSGQYIIITHNDSLITEAPVIYGVSMQDKISQILSLEV